MRYSCKICKIPYTLVQKQEKFLQFSMNFLKFDLSDTDFKRAHIIRVILYHISKIILWNSSRIYVISLYLNNIFSFSFLFSFFSWGNAIFQFISSTIFCIFKEILCLIQLSVKAESKYNFLL